MESRVKKLRKAWQNIRQRCENPNSPNYRYYGARGVKVRFNRFEHFARHIGLPSHDKLSVDRIDSNGDYAHGNIRWATPREQAANKRNARKELWEQLELGL